MSQTLLTATNFKQFIKCAKFISISSDDLTNSNFIINQYIQALCKDLSPVQHNEKDNSNHQNDSKIFCVFLNQSYMNYSYIQMKCGYNLKNLKDNNQFKCLDLLSDLKLFEVSNDSDLNETEFDFSKFKNVLINQLIDFFNLDNKNTNIQTNVQVNNATRVLIIDDITSFFTLNVQLNDLVNFINLIKHFCFFHQVTLIVQNYVDSSRLDQLAKLDVYLNSISNLVLIIRKLETGYSNKVDGNLEIRNYTAKTQKSYLFKSTERTTKLYPPGSI